MQINWSLLGAPVGVDTQGAALQGYALRQRVNQQRRQEEFTRSAFDAFNPETGQFDPRAMRSAFMAAGDVPGLMEFEQQQTQARAGQQDQARQQLLSVARLLDDATDPESYQRGLAAAQQMGLDVSSAPPTFDPNWVAQQRRIVQEFIERPQEMTTFMRDAMAAGIQPGSPEFRQTFQNRYAAPPRIVTGPNGELLVVGGGQAPAADAPPVLTDDDFRENGGAGSGPRNFP